MEHCNCTLKVATEKHVKLLVEFGRQQFTHTFGYIYTAENLESFLDESYTEESFINWIKDNNYCCFIAFDDKDIIMGYILAGKNSLPLQNCGFDDAYTSNAREIKR